MTAPQATTTGPESLRRGTEMAVRLSVLALLLYWCFAILRPFLIPLVWGITLAVAFHPVFVRVERFFGGRRKIAATVLVVVGLAALLVPTLWLSESLLDGARFVSEGVQSGSLEIPPAPEKVAEWPLVGRPLYETWNLASTNLQAVMQRYRDEVAALGGRLVAIAKQGAVAVALTAVAILIAAFLLVRRERAGAMARGVGFALAGERGIEFVGLARAMIGTVAKGVVGVAAIQALLAAVGLVAAGVPGAGLWALLVLILAVAQLPPILVLGPAILYVVSRGDSTATSVLFTIWSLLVSVSDAVLKPLLMGRGADVPVGVVLLGAIGGLIFHGLIGLFVGAVVLSIGYRLFLNWVEAGSDGTTRDPAERAPSAHSP